MNKRLNYHFEDNIIPSGYRYKEGTIDDGLVVESKLEGSQYVRIPDGYTVDGRFIRGFWISRYEISIGEYGIPRSVPNEYPVTNINFYEAMELADKVEGCLLSDEEYNRICMWLIESEAVGFEEVFIDGCNCGNYSEPFVIAKTGSNPLWEFNHIDNLWGNCSTFTKEYDDICAFNVVIRGGHGKDYFTKLHNPLAYRALVKQKERYEKCIILNES